MHVRIQRGTAVPVSRQIDSQLRAQILSGTLPAESQLPSVRQLAKELAVNVNTVFRVYEKLAADGLIELRHGAGTFVSVNSGKGRFHQLAERTQFLQQDLDALLRRGLMLGLQPQELSQMVNESLERIQTSDTPPD